MRQVSTRLALFVLVLMGFLILTTYQAVMKAFLQMSDKTLPFESYAEILESNLDVVTFKGSADEDYFKGAPEGSILRRIYDEKISHYPGVLELGTEETIYRVKSNQAIYAGDLGTILGSSKNPCDLIDLKSIR